MAITINGKSYNSYEEQILENKENIEKMKPLVIGLGETIPLDKTRTYALIMKEWTNEGSYASINGINNSMICDVPVNAMVTITNYDGRVYIYVNNNKFFSTLYAIRLVGDYDCELREIK